MFRDRYIWAFCLFLTCEAILSAAPGIGYKQTTTTWSICPRVYSASVLRLTCHFLWQRKWPSVSMPPCKKPGTLFSHLKSKFEFFNKDEIKKKVQFLRDNEQPKTKAYQFRGIWSCTMTTMWSIYRRMWLRSVLPVANLFTCPNTWPTLSINSRSTFLAQSRIASIHEFQIQ